MLRLVWVPALFAGLPPFEADNKEDESDDSLDSQSNNFDYEVDH